MKDWQAIARNVQPRPDPRLPQHGRRTIGSQTRAAWLRDVCTALGVEVRKLVEVGVCNGRHAQELRREFKEAELWLIDPWRHLESMSNYLCMKRRGEGNDIQWWGKMYERIVAQFGGDPRNHILRTFSRTAALGFPDGHFDCVYLDADHRYPAVCEDIRLWLPKVRKGGILAGHDYKKSKRKAFQVWRAVHESLGEENIVPGPDKNWLHLVR